MVSRQELLGERFRELHRRPGTFIIPNPFDRGSARLLAQAGFEALATSSAGYAFSAGRSDHAVARSEMLCHLRSIVEAVDLPVSADLANGFADSPESVAETVELASRTGIVGASIEDSTGRSNQPLYPLELAADRIRAAAEIARGLPFAFTLTARAENFLVGNDDLSDVIVRLQSYQDAGADVLYAPGLCRAEDISAVVRSVDRPINVVAGLGGCALTRPDLEALGVKRISVGSALARAAYGAVSRAATEMAGDGAFTFAGSALPYKELNDLFATGG